MKVKIEDLIRDNEFYPRIKMSWLTVYQYAEALKLGQKFPPILAGKIKGKEGLFVIDGFTRIQANLNMGNKEIETEIKNYDNTTQAFIDAISLNLRHGQRLSVQERVRIIDKLRKMKFTQQQISDLLAIDIEKIEKFTYKKIVHSISGETIYLKSALSNSNLKEKLEQMSSEDIEQSQDLLSTRKQIQLLDQLINLGQNNLFIHTKKFEEKVKELIALLQNYLSSSLVQSSDVGEVE